MAEAKSRNTVFVGCKLPHGLNLQLFDKGETDEGKPVYRPAGEPVTIKGRNAALVAPGGYGVTEVDKDFWEAWIKANSTFPAVKAGLIFAEARRDRAMDRAVDQQAAPTGSEPLNPDKPAPGLERIPEKEVGAAADLRGA